MHEQRIQTIISAVDLLPQINQIVAKYDRFFYGELQHTFRSVKEVTLLSNNLIACQGDISIRIFNTLTGELVSIMVSNCIENMYKLLYTTHNCLNILNPYTGESKTLLENIRIDKLISLQGNKIVILQDTVLTMWNLNTYEPEMLDYQTHDFIVLDNNVIVSFNKSKLISWSKDIINKCSLDDDILELHALTDGKFVTADANQTIRVWNSDLSTEYTFFESDYQGDSEILIPLPNNQIGVTVPGKVKIWSEGKLLHELYFSYSNVTFFIDNDKLKVITRNYNQDVKIIDVQTEIVEASFSEYAHHIIVLPDYRIMTLSRYDILRIWH